MEKRERVNMETLPNILFFSFFSYIPYTIAFAKIYMLMIVNIML